MTPAHVAKARHVQMETGLDVSYPTTGISDIVDLGKSLAVQARPLTAEEERQLIRAGAALALNPPSVNTHVGVGVGLGYNTEAQGRLVSGGWRLGARYQFLNQATHGVDLSGGLGLGRISFSPPGADIFEPLLTVDDYTRWQFDLPLLVGMSGNWYRWWGGPRMMLGSFDGGMKLSEPTEGTVFDAKLSGTSSYLGGQLGGALGYKKVFLALELTVVGFGTRAEVVTNGAVAGDFKTDVSGVVVYPAIGLLGDF